MNDDALRAYQAKFAAWVLGADFSQLHATNNVPAKALNVPEFAAANLHPQLCAKAGAVHFFVKTAWGVMELRGIALRNSWKVKGDAAGYLYAGRLWTNRDAQEMGAITGDDVRLSTSGPEQAQPAEGAGLIAFERDLKGADGQPVAWLRVRHVTSVIAAFQRATDELSIWLIVFAAVVLVILAAALGQLVSTPLHVITRSLHTRDLAPLQPLSRRRSEIGELAGLITEFHAQRDQLVQQMDERLAAEHALEESEERLRQAQKMEAIGRLAGGVAHDFNNLLDRNWSAMRTSSRQIRTPIPRRAARQAPSCRRFQQAAALTQQLLAFSRKQILQPKVLDANLLVANMERLLRRIIGEHIDIRTELTAMHGSIKADPHQVEQVVLNLAVNARDAMPRGGKLLLKTSNQSVTENEVNDLPAGDYVVLQVTDNGQGMDRETIARIFEPFFTTKVAGKGTGLGLATVYGIVQQSGGGIRVDSEQGKGSTFSVYFPRSTEPIQPLATAVTANEKPGGGETILVVDDQKLVASLVGDVLKGDGYRVLVAGGPSEAIGFFREHKIDLLITDLVMPRIDGRTLSEMAAARHEDLKVLYISGYSETGHDGEAPGTQLLFKPFTPDALSRKVREILYANEVV